MKKLVSVQEVSGEGLEALMGEYVLIFCLNYFYTGRLIGVNTDCILLEEAKIVYETGSFSEKGYTDAQSLPASNWYIQRSHIESFGRSK